MTVLRASCTSDRLEECLFILQPLDEEALAALMKGVDEHKAAAEKQFSEGASKSASQRRTRTRSSAPARRRAAGPEESSSEGDEVQTTNTV